MIRQLLIATLVGLALSAPSNKIDGQLLQVLRTRGTANIIVSYSDTQEVLNSINSMRFANRAAKITFLKSQLEQLAEQSQASTLQILGEKALSFNSFWINNRVFVANADLDIVNEIANLPEVTGIRQEIVVQILEPVVEANNSVFAEWGISKIEAEAAWALPGGNNGQGVVVSAIDTGVRYTHEAVRNNFRSQKGWFDPYSRTANPTDGNGHGTHVMGTIAGSGGIGVAPGAQWIACRGCNTASCTENALTQCGQFINCPTDTSGQNPDCSLAPAVVSNSWGGGQGSTWYDSVINAWQTSGIVPVFAMGNSGPSCGSANSPGDNANVIGVGSTTDADAISSFSSRGPTVRGAVKPDVSAPGSNVRSSWHTSDTAYNTISGTSMATPHVSGTVALLLAQNPNLSYNQVKALLENNTDRSLGSATTCGGTPPTTFPNNIYGYGRINARKSLAAAISGF